jgi:predicted site-specific integrase-resolvase
LVNNIKHPTWEDLGKNFEMDYRNLAKLILYHLKQKVMPTEIVTTDDLREFKIELVKEIKQMLAVHHGQPSKKWLKSFEVRKLLGISPGTLQNMRINGTLPYTKIGGVMFYDYEDIKKMLEANQVQNRFEFNRRR